MSKSTALLVIDVQQSFRARPYFDEMAALAFFDRSNALVRGFVEQGLPVVRILHVDGDGPFSAESGLVVPMPEVEFEPAATFTKHVHSALVDSGLRAWLTAQGIERLAISGIRTEQCCETTTRHGSDIGFEVDYVSEATLTFPMTHRNGRTFSAEEIRERTELVLEGRFATICDVGQAIERAAEHRR